jgi:hypothetical protein
VDVSTPDVRRAVERAAGHDVVVVVGASTRSAIPPLAQLLRVGAMAIDGTLAQEYAEDGVDVVAPGVSVSSVGISGTGTFHGTGSQYAVAFVAGQAALIRGVDRNATAAEVANRIRSTATPLASGERPNEYSGWGLINLDLSMQQVAATPEVPGPAAGPGSGSGGSRAVIWVTLAVVVVIGVLLILRLRRVIRAGRPGDGVPPPPPAPPVPGPDGPAWNALTPPAGLPPVLTRPSGSGTAAPALPSELGAASSYRATGGGGPA